MSEVITNGSEPSKKKPPLKWIIIGVVVIAVAAIAGLLLRNVQDKDQKQPATQELRPLQEDVAKAQEHALTGEYQKAHEDLQKALQRSGISAEERYQLLYQQGVTYENEKKYDEALTNYQQAADIKQTQNIYASMANVAEQQGNKPKAIEYYKKAIQLIASDNPIGQDDKDSYEQKIRDLGGQP